MTTAETLIAKLEKLPLGEPCAEALAAADRALSAARVAAEAALYPLDLAPTSAEAIAEYTWHTSRFGVVGYGERLADLHARALVSHPQLARLLRSREAFDDIGTAAAQRASPAHNLEAHATAQARAWVSAVARYKLDLEAQIAAVDGHELGDAARQLLRCEALSVRLAAVKARHEAHAAAEIEIERAAAASVAAESVHRDPEADAAEAARLGRVRALAKRLELRMQAAARGGTLAGRTRLEFVFVADELHSTAEVLAAAAQMMPEQLAVYEHALDSEESP